MQWDASPNAGFSLSSTTWLPVNNNYIWLNVLAQMDSHNTHLGFYRDVMAVRQEILGQDYGLALLEDKNVLILSYYCSVGMARFLLVNFSKETEQTVDLWEAVPGCLTWPVGRVRAGSGESEEG